MSIFFAAALISSARNKFIKSMDLFGQKCIFYLANLQKLASSSKCIFLSKISYAFMYLFLTFGITNVLFGTFEDSLFDSELLPPQKNQEQLTTFLAGFDEKDYEIVETEDARFYVKEKTHITQFENKRSLFEQYIKEGSIVVDYGAENGINTYLFSNLVGITGKVIAFESSLYVFRELFWNMSLNQVSNISLYCTAFGKKERTLDSLELKNVSLIKINCEEGVFLKGARETIKRCKPVLIIKMLDGISPKRVDHYVKEAFEKRIDTLKSMGYILKKINQDEFLALPR